ncbi:hypothetical protein [Lawsonibacter sp. JLR.KK007]
MGYRQKHPYIKQLLYVLKWKIGGKRGGGGTLRAVVSANDKMKENAEEKM